MLLAVLACLAIALNPEAASAQFRQRRPGSAIPFVPRNIPAPESNTEPSENESAEKSNEKPRDPRNDEGETGEEAKDEDEKSQEKKEAETNAPRADSDGTARSLVLPDNGDLRRKLDKVRGLIDGQNYTDAARELGRFLQDSEIRDFFLNRDDQRRGGRGFLSEVRRLLRELPPEGLAAYKVQFEALARGRLNAAISQGDEAAFRDVVARFPETIAGDEALFRLAVFLRDHGHDRAAVACLKRLQFRPESLADDVRWVAFLEKFAPADGSRHPIASDWMTYRGNSTRNRSAPAQAPFLAPNWSRPATEDSTSQLAIDRAWQWCREGHAVALPMPGPLVIGDLIFTRTLRGVTVCDFETGRTLWSLPSDDDGDSAGLDQILWSEPAGGAFSLDEECVYLIQDSLLGDGDAGTTSSNRLFAHEHRQAREGKLRWSVGGLDGGAEPRLAGVFFLGAPMAWQGTLCVLAELKGGLSLLVLDRSRGNLIWSQELVAVERGIAADPLRRTVGASPSISADEISVCPTSGGVVVAVDLTTQSLLWAYRYPRETAQPESVGEIEIVQQIDQSQRWLDSTALISGSRVILAPPESQQLHCLDLMTGRPLWSTDRNHGLFVACATDEHVVVVSRYEIRAHKLQSGEVAWVLKFPGHPPSAGRAPTDATAHPQSPPPSAPQPAYPAGRGVFTGDRYFLSVTTATILEIDLTAGTLIAEHKSPRELTPGNLVWHQGRFISYGPAALEVFDERERLSADVESRLRANPRDAASLVRRGELELSTAGRLAEAVATFREAHQISPSPRTKARLVAALLDAMRENAPSSDQLSDELDRLIGP
jgi:hypothetical protein